ncbi:hypothetical protein IAQ61_008259 [Plenodomus lingam]|uniref:uncharacterized protein n=1 Tax=Leptosphaeria maculans TaxID=5022 RepID=UPI00331A8743|nr:hypothetical protein IAQ61_008259 [Plenodomus lingam]
MGGEPPRSQRGRLHRRATRPQPSVLLFLSTPSTFPAPAFSLLYACSYPPSHLTSSCFWNTVSLPQGPVPPSSTAHFSTNRAAAPDSGVEQPRQRPYR